MGDELYRKAVEFDADEPCYDLRFRPIISPKPHSPVSCIITSQAYVGVLTHYYDRRTHPHVNVVEMCEGCQRRISTRWKAYMAGLLIPGGREVLVELTTNALDKCPRLRELKGRLRGLKIRLWRIGDSRNGPVMAGLEEVKGDCRLPEPFNIQEALFRVWGLSDDAKPNDGDLYADKE